MADDTPGQVAYAAYRAAYGHAAWMPTWTDLLALNHRAWEAAAAAVLAPRRTDQAAQLHQLIDALVAHAAPVLLDKVHLWLSDVTASAHHPLTILQEGDEGA